MNEKELADELRKRQLEKFLELKNLMNDEDQKYYSKEIILSILDKDMISSYIICSNCREWLVTYSEALDLASRCKNVDEWLDKTEEIMRGH